MEWLFQPSYLGVRSSGVYSCKDYTNSHPNEVALYIQTCLKGVTHGKPKKTGCIFGSRDLEKGAAKDK